MSITEIEFLEVANAAMENFRAGNINTALVFDELARKMNRELTIRNSLEYRKHGPGIGPKPFHVDSPLEAAGLRKRTKLP